VSAQVNIFRVV